jgi:cyclin-dependent kinase regulatory subunit CKS1
VLNDGQADILKSQSTDPNSALLQMDIDLSRRNKKPRLLLESERERLEEFIDSIHYSARYEHLTHVHKGRIDRHRYSDDQFEYRHVQLPKNMLKKIPADYFDSSKGTLKLLWEEEWRALGITQVLRSALRNSRSATLRLILFV